MVDRKLYAKDFEPIVQPGEYIEVYPKKPREFYVVGMVYPLPLLSVNLADSDHLGGAVTTAESAEVQINDVYLDDGELGHLRVVPYDDFSITWMGKPKSRPYMTTKNKVWKIPKLDDPMGVAVEFFSLNEIFQFEDTEFWVKVTANAGSVDPARVMFFGYRMLLEKVASVPTGIRPTKIPVEGYPGSSL